MPHDAQQQSAEELARGAQEGCSACFAALVERFAGRLYGYLRHRVSSEHDAEDLVQETFLRALANLHRYRPERRFSTWLFTIATRLAVSHHRARRRQVNLDEVDRPDARADDPHESAWRRERDGSLWSAAAERLSEAQFAALWLHYVEDLPVAEIAAATGRSRIGVRVLLHRARRRLASSLWGRVAEPPLKGLSPFSAVSKKGTVPLVGAQEGDSPQTAADKGLSPSSGRFEKGACPSRSAQQGGQSPFPQTAAEIGTVPPRRAAPAGGKT